MQPEELKEIFDQQAAGLAFMLYNSCFVIIAL